MIDGDGERGWPARRVRDLRALSYYRPRQIAWRAVIAARRRAASWAPGAWREIVRQARETPVAADRPGADEPWVAFALSPGVTPPDRPDDLVAGRFRFLNHTVAYGDRPDWRCRVTPAPSHLWRMNLHYHRFLVDAAVGAHRQPHRRAELLSRAVRLLDGWTSACAVAEPGGWSDAWNSYAVSTRILNARLARRLTARLPGADAYAFGRRLDAFGASSTAFLEHWIEWDLGGNHLLRNACALVAAGRWFRGARATRWGQLGAEILEGALRDQFLSDGFHEERSPMYHALAIEDLLATLPEPADDAGAAARRAIAASLAALGSAIHPDGGIALFNDSAFEIAPPPGELRELAGGLAVAVGSGVAADAPAAGYFRSTAGNHTLIFDAGLLGPDHLPAHAHCDALSFEWSVGARRVVVDTGVDRYEAGAERTFQRSVEAHATLQVGGADQGEPFGSFRMGRRPRVDGTRIDAGTVEGSHDGFGAAGRHRRRIVLTADTGPAWTDWLEGDAEHPVTVRLGFAPGVSAHVDGDRLVVDAGEAGRWRWITPPHGRVRIATGTYCPEFGRSLPRLVALWEGTGGRGRALAFRISPSD